ncbi:hypothetical protein GCM10011386_07170 [Parapedobacter defluvii]|uniref:Uncharacterized protein n=1 Tax=Parapedobacter defluvii TaxID=2045106 RepID=A0ABQ1L7L4_9SPHI|nr:hypothetical protein [Parapedobacter defluvii]GGC17803.1 hypothetical protein GCM10011386_07170 [Parapedobacter defluvii]
MMHVCKKIKVVLVSLLLLGCDGEGTLLDLYPFEPIVNAETRVLIQDNQLIYARLHGRLHIDGTTEKGWFSTPDNFQSFDFEDRPWPIAQGVLGFADGLLVHAIPNGATWLLRFSEDDGKTWETSEGPGAAVSLMQVAVTANQTVWLLGAQEIGGNSRLLLYRIDLPDKRAELWYTKDNTTPLAIGFLGRENGWLLYRGQYEAAEGVRIGTTVDGGREWTERSAISRVTSPSLTLVDANRLLVYDRAGRTFLSSDGGTSFEEVAIGTGEIISCQSAGENVVYALLDQGVAKSSDGGKSWSPLEAGAHGVRITGTAMDFYNEQRGIVYGPDRLFFTVDGGKSWRMGVYPYDYVLE